MARTSRKSDLFTNPFYLVLAAVSTLFVVTALAYLASGFVLAPAIAPNSEMPWEVVPPSAWSPRFARWLDRNGPLALGVEFLVMLAAGVVMMATDRWYTERRKRKERGQG